MALLQLWILRLPGNHPGTEAQLHKEINQREDQRKEMVFPNKQSLRSGPRAYTAVPLWWFSQSLVRGTAYETLLFRKVLRSNSHLCCLEIGSSVHRLAAAARSTWKHFKNISAVQFAQWSHRINHKISTLAESVPQNVWLRHTLLVETRSDSCFLIKIKYYAKETFSEFQFTSNKILPALYSRKQTLGWGIKLELLVHARQTSYVPNVSFSNMVITRKPLQSEV